MKNFAKRSFSLLLALMMCLSLLPGITREADAAGYIYNWGHRGTTATYLSENAKAFYAENQVSYEDWLELSGGTATTAYQSTLYAELRDLMASNHTWQTSYEDTKPLFQYTDCQDGGGKISSFYSGMEIGPAWDGGKTWNREHTWPNSKGMEGRDEDDIMMLRPTAIQENSSRGNVAYGESASYFDPNGDAGGKYDQRGDVARIMLYVYVRWGNKTIWGEKGVLESMDVMLKWMREDPVDTWEMGRNDAVESITGTRNVFVDYPELAFLLFSQPVPGNMTTPSGKAAEATCNITATSNNTAWGTVAVSGMNINATPAQGYRAAGYQVLSGSASVEQMGNVFVVKAQKDCAIQIIFEKRLDITVRFLQDGVETSSANKLQDDVITMPGHTGAEPEGYTFRGWLTTTLAETATAPKMLLVGQSYTLAADTTFYAVYSRLETGTGDDAVHFEKFTGEVVEGDYLIVLNERAMKAEVNSGGRLNYLDVVSVEDTISNPDPSLVWHIAPLGDGTWTIYNKSTGKYAAGTGVKNKAQLLSAVSDLARWTPSGEGTYEFKNKGNDAAGVSNCWLRGNTTYGFACYGTTTGTPSLLYKGDTGTNYYTTSVTPEVTYTVAAVSGNDTWGSVSVEGNVITATAAHGYQVGGFDVVSGEADVTRQGSTFLVTPYSDCTVRIDFVAREKAVYAIVENGTTVNSWDVFVGDTVELPGYSGTVPTGYTFEGWTDAPVANADSAPVFCLKPNDSFIITENTTFHALFKSSYYTTSIYTVTAVSGNEAWGSVSVEGNTITATPAHGYQVGGFDVVSGEADVTRQGSTFLVTPYSDCTLRIDFVARERVSYTLMSNGSQIGSQDAFAGDTLQLPEYSGTVPAGYTFVGWTDAPAINADTAPSFCLKAGDDFVITENTTFHALFKATCYTTAIYNIQAVPNNDAFGTVTVSGQTVTAEPADGYQVSSYTLVRGTAHITRSGNTLTVRATSDCTICVIFEERTTSNIIFLENGTEVDRQEVYAPATAVAPKFSGNLLKGYTFAGWTIGQYQGQELPASVIREQDTFQVTGDTVVYALYQANGYTTAMVEIPRTIHLDAESVGEATSAWVNGREYPIYLADGVPCVDFAEGVEPTDVVVYTWFEGDASDVHTKYPTGMKVWTVALTNGAYTATRHAGLDNLLQYSGCSIRIVGKKGIRMITSVNKDQKKALTGKGLEGYTLVEYGTVLGFASKFTAEEPLRLGHPDAKSNYAYKKGVADPVFATSGNLVQYTNVLVGFTNDQCKEDIAMRPYIILQDAQGNQVTLYGGIIYRSIGYIAYQNRTVFKTGSEAYNYVWEIIHHVYGDQFDADYKG